MGGAVCAQLAQLLHLAHPGPFDAYQVFHFFVFVHMCTYIHTWTYMHVCMQIAIRTHKCLNRHAIVLIVTVTYFDVYFILVF
jgi:hypothetical protein